VAKKQDFGMDRHKTYPEFNSSQCTHIDRPSVVGVSKKTGKPIKPRKPEKK
jgi:hypothetical protein